jgi:hypothetical protein
VAEQAAPAGNPFGQVIVTAWLNPFAAAKVSI